MTRCRIYFNGDMHVVLGVDGRNPSPVLYFSPPVQYLSRWDDVLGAIVFLTRAPGLRCSRWSFGVFKSSLDSGRSLVSKYLVVFQILIYYI